MTHLSDFIESVSE